MTRVRLSILRPKPDGHAAACLFHYKNKHNSIIEMDIFANFSHHHSNFRVKYNLHLYNGNFRTQKSGFNCYTAYHGHLDPHNPQQDQIFFGATFVKPDE